MVLRRKLLFLFLQFAVAAALYGQANTATVYGTVTDQSGAILPSVAVSAKNSLTGIKLTTSANTEGQFTFNFLPVGNYSFVVESAGFQTQVRNGVALSAGQTAQLVFQLALSATKEAITVSAEAPALNAETAEQHTTIGRQDVQELPLAKKDWSGLLQLANGVTKSGSSVSLNG